MARGNPRDVAPRVDPIRRRKDILFGAAFRAAHDPRMNAVRIDPPRRRSLVPPDGGEPDIVTAECQQPHNLGEDGVGIGDMFEHRPAVHQIPEPAATPALARSR